MLEKSLDLSFLVDMHDIDVETSYGWLNVVLECYILIFVEYYLWAARYHDEQGQGIAWDELKTEEKNI